MPPKKDIPVCNQNASYPSKGHPCHNNSSYPSGQPNQKGGEGGKGGQWGYSGSNSGQTKVTPQVAKQITDKISASESAIQNEIGRLKGLNPIASEETLRSAAIQFLGIATFEEVWGLEAFNQNKVSSQVTKAPVKSIQEYWKVTPHIGLEGKYGKDGKGSCIVAEKFTDILKQDSTYLSKIKAITVANTNMGNGNLYSFADVIKNQVFNLDFLCFTPVRDKDCMNIQ